LNITKQGCVGKTESPLPTTPNTVFKMNEIPLDVSEFQGKNQTEIKLRLVTPYDPGQDPTSSMLLDSIELEVELQYQDSYKISIDTDGNKSTWEIVNTTKSITIDSFDAQPGTFFIKVTKTTGSPDLGRNAELVIGTELLCWDNDTDGFFDAVCGGLDCDDNSTDDPPECVGIDCADPTFSRRARRINPNATEVCNDLVDNDCDEDIDEEDCDCGNTEACPDGEWCTGINTCMQCVEVVAPEYIKTESGQELLIPVSLENHGTNEVKAEVYFDIVYAGRILITGLTRGAAPRSAS
jgi:hypothetical protein